MKSIIILIGPMSVGKSTIAQLLSIELGLPRIELDEVRQTFYNEIGYDESLASKIAGDIGLKGLIKYWNPFEVHAVERAVEEFDDCILDFGAGHSVYDEELHISMVENVLKSVKHVILLLPSPDPDRSVEILNQRFTDFQLREVGRVDEELLRLNEYYIRHPSNHILAKRTFYTDGKSPEETCREIVDWIKSS
jgi:shikimate kinase